MSDVLVNLITILTGFLGSGKTTLLKRVLSEPHGQKIAVIENEFGEENIDNDILLADGREQIVQMSNGCICCTIREDLRLTLRELADKRRNGELQFERVVIETTGLADPGPVAQTFFLDNEIANRYLLDSILTLVDAKHAAPALHNVVQPGARFACPATVRHLGGGLAPPEGGDELCNRWGGQCQNDERNQ